MRKARLFSRVLEGFKGGLLCMHILFAFSASISAASFSFVFVFFF